MKKHTKGWDRNSVMIEGRRQPQLIIYDKDKVEHAVKNKTLDLSVFARIIENDNLETKESDVWADIHILNSQSKERTGYPTQKPLPLLHRIIKS